MRRFLLNIPALIALALLCALAAPTANAQDIPSRMESVDVFIDVQQNGDMLVQETFVYAFQRQGISFTGRFFRLESVDDVDQVSISMDGRDLPVEIDRGERRIRLDWEHPPVQPPGDPHLRSPLPGAGRAEFWRRTRLGHVGGYREPGGALLYRSGQCYRPRPSVRGRPAAN